MSVGDADVVAAIASIVATCDMSVLTAKGVRAELETRFGADALSERTELIKATIKAEAAKRVAQAEAEQELPKGAQRQEEKEREEKEEEADATPKGKKRQKPSPPSPRLDDVPTNVEMEVDLRDFLRRGPSRAGRKVTKLPPVKKERKKKSAAADGDNEEGQASSAKKRKSSGFGKPVMVNEDLAKELGVETLLPRTQVVKALSAYIKAKSLQDPKDGRKIIFKGSPLEPLFKTPRTTYFGLQKLLTERKLIYNPSEVVGGEDEMDDDENEVEDEQEQEQDQKQEHGEQKQDQQQQQQQQQQQHDDADEVAGLEALAGLSGAK